MMSLLRPLGIYVFLMVVFRLAGRRTLSEMTSFEFVVILIMAEATQQGMIGRDFSMTNAMIVILTLVGTDVLLSGAKRRWRGVQKVLEGVPTILVDDGRLLEDRMRKARVDETDILAAARKLQGLERLDQIRWAVLESNGGISIIPKGGN
ncbi:MAG: DUF421 domain-containing protein [Candidatus Eisenbacteria bacterium]|nr:DUF421 domain-containing protein [Candidatus Eisenbacteria bacterium]